ncbi:MAG: hypothetical protein QM737_04325 [Ferruginibacter sp.]
MSMRSTRLLFLFIFFIFIKNSNTAFAQSGPAIKWQKCIGGNSDDRANDVIINPDGSFIVVGFSYSNDGNITDHHADTDNSDGLIVKLDPSGNIIWIKSIGGTGDDVFQSVIATNDNAYLCIGYTNSSDGDITNAHGQRDAWLVKINAAGNIIWSKCYGGTKSDIASDGVLTPDGAYAMMGTSYSSDGDVLSGVSQRTDADGWAFKVSANGTLLWESCIGSNREENGFDIIVSENNTLYGIVSSLEDYTFSSGTLTTTLTHTPGYLYELNNDNGMGAWSPIASIGGDSGFSMCRKADSTYYSYTDLNFTYPQSCNDHNLFLGKKGDNSYQLSNSMINYTTNCDIGAYYREFARLHGSAADENALVFAGRTFSGSYGSPDLYGGTGNALIGTRSATNNLVRYTTYGGAGRDAFSSIKVFPGGKDYIVVGCTNSTDGDVSGSGSHGGYSDFFECCYDFWIVRMEAANKVTGNVFLDANNNGIKDAGELPFNYDMVKTSKAGSSQSSLPYNGVYLNTTDTGIYTTTLLLNRPYYTFTPASKTSVFTTYKNTDTANFAVHAIPGIQDYSLSVIPLTPVRAGFEVQYKIVYQNNGTTTLTNKTVTFVKDSRASFLNAVPAIASISGDTIRWNIASLAPTTGGSITLYLQLGAPPVSNWGETIVSSALIDSTGDNTPVDNYTVLTQNVTGSYDPNDKQENFGGELYPPDITAGKYLSYTIRFQNTGNDTAFNIIIRDTLDNKLKGDSIEFVGASHPYQASISENKYLKVSFSDIRLVDSLHNEPLSHGYFSYRVKPTSTLVIGDTIKNTAYIYFDFNPPIKTNTQLTFVRPVPVNVLWTGAVSTAWEDQNNWGNHLVPDDKTNVLIESGLARYPIISSNAICRSILVKTGASVLVRNGFSFKVMH